MGVKQEGSERFERSLDPGRLMSRVNVVMGDVLERGKDSMVNKIETRGTGNTWQSPWGGRSASTPGRDDSGQMKSDVKGEVTEHTGTHVRGMLGWPEGSPEYYRHQEHGFFHVLAQRDVMEMGALRDASEETTTELVEELTKIARQM